MIKISFIVPVYNVEKYLRECLNSLENQTYKNIEIVLINDGSTDSSASILSEYVGRDDRFVLVNQKNQGLSSARNVGFNHVTGDYVFYVDSDDYVSYDSAEVVVDSVNKYGNVDIITFFRSCFYSNRPHDMDMLSVKLEKICSGKEFLLNAIKLGRFRASVCIKVFSRRFLEFNDFKFVSGLLYEDMIYSLTTFLHARKVLQISNILYHYRRDNIGSITRTISKKDIDVLKTLEFAQLLFFETGNDDILKSKEWQAYMFKWVVNATFFKYPVISFFSHQGWDNCMAIKRNPIFVIYLESVIRNSNSRVNLRIASILIKYNLFFFYVIRKLSKVIFPNHRF